MAEDNLNFGGRRNEFGHLHLGGCHSKIGRAIYISMPLPSIVDSRCDFEESYEGIWLFDEARERDAPQPFCASSWYDLTADTTGILELLQLGLSP